MLGLRRCMHFSPVSVSGSHSPRRHLRLGSRSSGPTGWAAAAPGSVDTVHGCSVECGMFPDQGGNPCLLYCQADSQPLTHQEVPDLLFLNVWCWVWISGKGSKSFIKLTFRNIFAVFALTWCQEVSLPSVWGLHTWSGPCVNICWWLWG